MKPNDIVITGLPRSGTTLVCHLLNKVINTIALHEPIKIKTLKHLSEDEICNGIVEYFENTRANILLNKEAISLQVKNKIPDNHMGSAKNKKGLRQKTTGTTKGSIKIDKELTSDFNLCIKHNAIFSLLLGRLQQMYQSYAVIRNPLSLLASWSSVQLPINRGHIPAAEKVSFELAQKISGTNDVIDRQILIMSWFFEQFSNLPNTQILRYEDIITTGGAVLKCVVKDAQTLNEPLQSKNLNELYDHTLMLKLGEKLLASNGHIWDFYNKSDIKKLMSKIML